MYKPPYQGVANQLSQYGRYGDSQLVHMNPIEVQMLAQMSPTGQLTRNPMTGQPEAFLPFLAPLLGSFLGSSLLTGAGAGILGAAGLSSAAAGAIGSGLATAAVTGDLEQGILSGITGFGLGQAFGAAGDALSKAGAETATQAATQGVTEGVTGAVNIAPQNLGTMANAPMESFLPQELPIDQLNLNVPNISAAQQALLETPLSAGMQAAPQALQRLGTMPMEQFAKLPPQPLSAVQRMAAPFQEPSAFLKQLAEPSSFLPMYVGETGRMAREQELMGRGSMQAFNEEQEAERQKTLSQMGSVFNQVRSAYPNIGYAEGGMVEGGKVEKYFDGGSIEEQARRAAELYGSSLPVAENVQLGLRGAYAQTPPTASYSALDVGGAGYLPGVAPEFQYFTNAAPPGTAPSTPSAPPAGVSPGGRYGGVDISGIRDYLSNYSALQYQPSAQFDPTQYSQLLEETLSEKLNPLQERLREMETESLLQSRLTPLQEELARLQTQNIFSQQFNPLQQQLSEIGSALATQSQVNPFRDELARLQVQDYLSQQFSPIQQRIGELGSQYSTLSTALTNRPTSQQPINVSVPVNLGGIGERLGGIEQDIQSLYDPEGFFLGNLNERLAAIESRPTPTIDYSKIPTIDYSKIPQLDLSGLESRLAGLESQLGRAPSVDFSGLESRFAGLESRLANLPAPVVNAPTVDLSGLESRLGGLESRLGSLQFPTLDLSGLESRLSSIESRPVPQFDYSRISEYIPSFDTSALESRLGGLESRLGSIQMPNIDLSGIESRLASIEGRSNPEFDYTRIPSYVPPDFSGLESRLGSLEQGLGSLRSSIPSAPDLSGIYGQLGTLQSQLGSLSSSIPAAPDLSGIYNRFGQLESQLGAVRSSIPSAPDLSGIYGQLGTLQSQLGSLSSSIPAAPDLSGIYNRFGSLESQLGSLRSSIPSAPDLSGIYSQLGSLQSQVGAITPTNIDPVLQRLAGLEALLANQPTYNNPYYEYQYPSAEGGFAEGGATSDAVNPPMANPDDQQQLVMMAVAAIRGEIDNADEIIKTFVDRYGSEAFMQLRNQVLREIVPGAQTEGMVDGQGGGQDDLVEGMIGSQRPVAVSPGEYIIPADVVSLAGGGYSGDGAKFFDGLVDDIRQKTMGTTEQIKPYRETA